MFCKGITLRVVFSTFNVIPITLVIFGDIYRDGPLD